MGERLKYVICFIIISASITIGAQAQQSLIDEVDNTLLDTLIAHAKRNYPRVKIFEARTNTSKANLKRQKLGWFDALTFSYVLQPSNGVAVNATNPVFLNGYQFGLFANVGSLLQRPAVIKQAKEEIKVFEYEALEYDKNLVAEVKKRYYDYLQQFVLLRLVARTVIDGQALLESVRIRYEKSELSFDEYTKVVISTNGNIQTKLETETSMLTAISSIEEMIGTDFLALKKKYGVK